MKPYMKYLMKETMEAEIEISKPDILYHVTDKKNIPRIESEGISPQRKASMTGQMGQDVRKDKKAVYAFTDKMAAVKMAFDINEWGTVDNARIISFKTRPDQDWEIDTHVEAQMERFGHWLKARTIVEPEDIVKIEPLTKALVQARMKAM